MADPVVGASGQRLFRSPLAGKVASQRVEKLTGLNFADCWQNWPTGKMPFRSHLAAEVASQREDILLLLVQLEDLADAFGSAQERYSPPLRPYLA